MSSIFRAYAWKALSTCLIIAETTFAEHNDNRKHRASGPKPCKCDLRLKPELIIESVSSKLQKLGYNLAKGGEHSSPHRNYHDREARRGPKDPFVSTRRTFDSVAYVPQLTGFQFVVETDDFK
jgi:hypothetical protein